jgi:GntR family transcriptional regulator
MPHGIDHSSDRAAYRQIADRLREAMARGDLEPGEQLPSERALIEQYGAARGTVRQAIGILRSEGLVTVEHGRGAFVRRQPPIRRLAHDRFARRHRKAGKAAFLAEAEAEGRRPQVEVLHVGPEDATTEVAARLELEGPAQVLVRQRRYLADGEPVELATSYLPWEVAEGTAICERDTGPGGIYARLEERGHQLARFTEEVSARMPLPDEVRALRLTAGVPVFRLIRTAYDIHGRAVEICDTVMAADRFVLSYELPAS